MASRTGMFLSDTERDKIISDLACQGEPTLVDKATSTTTNIPKEILDKAAAFAAQSGPPATFSTGTGCLGCGEDDDHANLLLCEGCNAEYHTYCLSPPLRSVPAGDWFCSKFYRGLVECEVRYQGHRDSIMLYSPCRFPSLLFFFLLFISTARCRVPNFVQDGLDQLVCALPPSITSRFGEICWAQGGVGFGWWPSFIYDPRLTVGNARQLARKYLGKRHLVYFFECHDAPFSCLADSKITKWEDGLVEDYHLGKTARVAGKARTQLFQQALQAATIEAGKPIEFRMEFNHTDQPQILPSPKMIQRKRMKPSRSSALSSTLSPMSQEKMNRKRTRTDTPSTSSRSFQGVPGFGFLSDAADDPHSQPQTSTRRNLLRAMEALAGTRTTTTSNTRTNITTNEIEAPEDGELCCKLYLNTGPTLLSTPAWSATQSTLPKEGLLNIGFVKLPSIKKSTFADARKVIHAELVSDCPPLMERPWRFFIPGLGPMSLRQETTLGPIFSLLRGITPSCSTGTERGNGLYPLELVIVYRDQSPQIGRES